MSKNTNKTEGLTLEISELEQISGLTGRRLRQLASSGLLPKPKRGEFPLKETLIAFIKYQETALHARTDLYFVERGLLTQARRKLVERELELTTGDSVSRKEVRESMTWLWSWLKIALQQQIEHGCPPLIMELKTDRSPNDRFHDIREILERGVDRVYSQLDAKLPTLVAPNGR